MHCFGTLLCCTFYLLVKQLKSHRGTTVQKCLLRVAIFLLSCVSGFSQAGSRNQSRSPAHHRLLLSLFNCIVAKQTPATVRSFALYGSATLAYAATVVTYVALYNCVSTLHSYNKDINPLQGAKLQKVLSWVQAGA